MRPVCLALDTLQGEEHAYAGILWPTLIVTLRKLHELKTNNSVAICIPLITVLIDSVQDRFDKVLWSMDSKLAMALHPHFRLSLLFQERQNEELAYVTAETKNRVTNKITNMLENLLDNEDVHNASSSSDETEETQQSDELFGFLFKKKNSRKLSASKLVESFFDMEPQRCIQASSFPHETLKQLFIKLNTPLPSSAAVERVFSFAKDILKPKRAGLSDEHFEMLLFLKVNK